MPINGMFYHVLISSPDDIKNERSVIPNWIQIWNKDNYKHKKAMLVPLKWEIDAVSEMGVDPQHLINGQLVDQSDIIIGIFWTKLGTETARSQSGSVEEVERGISLGKKVQVYFSRKMVDPGDIDGKQLKRLNDFKELCKKNGLYHEYNDEKELERKIYQSLSYFVDELQKKQIVAESLSDKTGELEKHEMAALSILLGRGVQDVEGTASHTLVEEMDNSGFSEVASRMSVEGLIHKGYIERNVENADFNYSSFVYQVTEKGVNWALEHQDAFELETKSRVYVKNASYYVKDEDIDAAINLDEDPF